MNAAERLEPFSAEWCAEAAAEESAVRLARPNPLPPIRIFESDPLIEQFGNAIRNGIVSRVLAEVQLTDGRRFNIDVSALVNGTLFGHIDTPDGEYDKRSESLRDVLAHLAQYATDGRG